MWSKFRRGSFFSQFDFMWTAVGNCDSNLLGDPGQEVPAWRFLFLRWPTVRTAEGHGVFFLPLPHPPLSRTGLSRKDVRSILDGADVTSLGPGNMEGKPCECILRWSSRVEMLKEDPLSSLTPTVFIIKKAPRSDSQRLEQSAVLWSSVEYLSLTSCSRAWSAHVQVVYVSLSEVLGSPGDQTHRTKAAPLSGMMHTTCRVRVSGLHGHPTQGSKERGLGSKESWGRGGVGGVEPLT